MSDPSRRWQVGLRALILLMAVVATWLTVHVNRRESARLDARIQVMKPLIRELMITDPSQFAAVKLDSLWIDDNRWDLYLPSGEYRLCLGTRLISSKGLTTQAIKTATIKGGKHRLELKAPRNARQRLIQVSSDGANLITFEEAKDWAVSGSYSGDTPFVFSAQQPTDQPLILLRRVYMAPSGPTRWLTPTEPSDGILLWIERVVDPEPI